METGGEFASPSLRVHGAVSATDLTVPAQRVGVEEVAGPVAVEVVGLGEAALELGRLSADIGALGSVVGAGEHAAAEEGVVAVGVQGGLNGAAEGDRASVVGDAVRGGDTVVAWVRIVLAGLAG